MRSVNRGICGAAILCATGGAAAQSSVTLYGVVDVFGQYVNNGGTSSFSERSGGNSGSLFGLKGTEDLGGGLKAIFDVENGYNVNNGSSFADTTAMFYRQAWVGLAHDRYGQLTFGRQYQPTFWAIYPGDPFRVVETLSPGAAAILVPDRATLGIPNIAGRTSNSVVYQSPTLYGLKLYAMYGFTATTTQPKSQTLGNMLDLALTYTGYGLYAGLAYQYQHAGTANVPGIPLPVNLVPTEHFSGSLAYRIGIVNLQAQYFFTRAADDPAGSVTDRLSAAHSYSIAVLGATIQATPFDAIEIAGFEREVRGADDRTRGIEVGWDHSLSKRTTVYARAGYMKNHGTAQLSWSGVSVTQPETSQTLVALGMTHRF